MDNLSILLIEDNEGDRRLIYEMIKDAGLKTSNYVTAELLSSGIATLKSKEFDVILLDLGLPDSQGIATLQALYAQAPETPIVVMTGLNDEETGIKAVQAGAQDYLVKGIVEGNLLVKSIRYAIERKNAVKMIKRLNHQNSMILNSAGEGIIGLDNQGRITFVNPSATEMLGYEVQELIGLRSHETWHHTKPDGSKFSAEDCPICAACWDGMVHRDLNNIFWRKDRSSFPVEYASTPIIEDNVITGAVVVFNDITERKAADKKIRDKLEQMRALRTIDMAITSSLDLHVTLNIFLEQVIDQLKVDAADIFLLTPTMVLEYTASRGFRTERIRHISLKIGDSCAGQVAYERRPIIYPDILKAQCKFLVEREHHFPQSLLIKEEDFKAYFGMPLIAKGIIKGVLEIFHREPFHPGEDWLEFLESLAAQAAIALDNSIMFDEIQKSHTELVLAYDSTIEGWARALDFRDKETEGHSRRVTDMTVLIAQRMGMSEEELVHIRRGALLHDIGKIGVSDNILLKPGVLTEQERALMKRHSEIAYEVLSPIAYLYPALDIPYCHHEKWDGTGYPRRLKGEQIPLSARIFAVVDVWDALGSDRPYRPAWPKEKTIEHIKSLSGSHFEPKVVDVFLEVLSEKEEH